MAASVDPELVLAWLTARSLVRGLPRPIPDRGGFRVDTFSPTELQRWVFPKMSEGLQEVAREISAPGYFIKFCGNGTDLMAVLPREWKLQSPRYMMTANQILHLPKPLPSKYVLKIDHEHSRTHARIIAPDGSTAGSGYAIETADVFVYDRIEIAVAHRRQGLGSAIMSALSTKRKATTTKQILVATEDGRRLYQHLGWSLYSSYVTATIE